MSVKNEQFMENHEGFDLTREVTDCRSPGASPRASFEQRKAWIKRMCRPADVGAAGAAVEPPAGAPAPEPITEVVRDSERPPPPPVAPELVLPPAAAPGPSPPAPRLPIPTPTATGPSLPSPAAAELPQPSPVTAGRPMAPHTAPDPPATLPLGDDLPELPSVPAAEFPPGPSAVPTGIMLTQGLTSSVSIGPLLERRPRRPSFAADTQALLSPAAAKPPALPSPAALPRRAEGPPARSPPPVKVPAALPPPATKRRRSPFPPTLASPCKTGREPTGQS